VVSARLKRLDILGVVAENDLAFENDVGRENPLPDDRQLPASNKARRAIGNQRLQGHDIVDGWHACVSNRLAGG